mmetsp:Transcript_9527/g.21873  ORF Transcript_9527/g.21873 Transcript_9527/m.21873 type:complete len:87 (+) Transcript_9527:73-333(+)
MAVCPFKLLCAVIFGLVVLCMSTFGVSKPLKNLKFLITSWFQEHQKLSRVLIVVTSVILVVFHIGLFYIFRHSFPSLPGHAALVGK